MQELRSHFATNSDRESARRIDAIGWGLFFIWIGIAFLADVGAGIAILGIGLIATGAQAARKYVGLPVEFFGLGMGLVMVAWGAWGFLQPQLGALDIPYVFWPIVFIVLGVALVARALMRGSPRHDAGPAGMQRE